MWFSSEEDPTLEGNTTVKRSILLLLLYLHCFIVVFALFYCCFRIVVSQLPLTQLANATVALGTTAAGAGFIVATVDHK
jgi:hypothetical protein